MLDIPQLQQHIRALEGGDETARRQALQSFFAYCTYLSDLAVHERHRRQGIGRELLRRTHQAGRATTTAG